MAFSHTFDTATPAGSDDPAEADDRMQEIKKALQERLNVEHVFDLTGTEVSHANSGKHTAITTTSIVNAGALTNTGNLTLNTDKFTVDAATGNVVVAGTLGVAGVATVAKGSLLASSDAPTTDAMIANKKYVDDTVAAEAMSPDPMTGANDSAGTVTFPNGLIWKWGKQVLTNGTEADTLVTFATPFPNACFQAFYCAGITPLYVEHEYIGSTHSPTAASFKIRTRIGTRQTPARWFAVGR